MTRTLRLLAGFWVLLVPLVASAGGFPVMINGRGTCEALWIERNQLVNLAGYCFETPLGQAVFDNDDCFTRAPELGQKAQSRIEALRAAENRQGCQVDTGQQQIRVYGRNGEIRFGQGGTVLGMWQDGLRRLDVFPVNPVGQTSCQVTGLDPNREGFLALRSGPDVRYQQIGRLINGDQVLRNTQCIGAWCFASQTWRAGAVQPQVGWFHTNWCQ